MTISQWRSRQNHTGFGEECLGDSASPYGTDCRPLPLAGAKESLHASRAFLLLSLLPLALAMPLIITDHQWWAFGDSCVECELARVAAEAGPTEAVRWRLAEECKRCK